MIADILKILVAVAVTGAVAATILGIRAWLRERDGDDFEPRPFRPQTGYARSPAALALGFSVPCMTETIPVTATAACPPWDGVLDRGVYAALQAASSPADTVVTTADAFWLGVEAEEEKLALTAGKQAAS